MFYLELVQVQLSSDSLYYEAAQNDRKTDAEVFGGQYENRL